MFYVMVYARPIGVDHVIYTNKPQWNESDYEGMEMWLPDYAEFNTEFEARLFIRKNRGKVAVEIKERYE